MHYEPVLMVSILSQPATCILTFHQIAKLHVHVHVSLYASYQKALVCYAVIMRILSKPQH